MMKHSVKNVENTIKVRALLGQDSSESANQRNISAWWFVPVAKRYDSTLMKVIEIHVEKESHMKLLRVVWSAYENFKHEKFVNMQESIPIL